MPTAKKPKPAPLPVGTVDAILTSDDMNLQTVEVPEWGCSIKVKPITLAEQDDIDGQSENDEGEVDAARRQVLWFVHGIADPKFTVEQAEKLRTKNPHAVLRVTAAIMKVNDASPEA